MIDLRKPAYPTHRRFYLFQANSPITGEKYFTLLVEGESPDRRLPCPTWDLYTVSGEWDVTHIPFNYEYATENLSAPVALNMPKGEQLPITKDLPYHVRKVIEHLVGIEI